MGQSPDPKLLNGFDLSDALIPLNEIKRGGPPRDGIPSIDQPVFLSASDQHSLNNNDQVLGVYLNGIAKAYPIDIMDWHEIVNDKFDGKGVFITYCPLCGSGIAFSSEFKSINLEFGVSGLLYNSDVLMYDRKTLSLWSQLMGKAVSGEYKNTSLEMIPTYNISWGQWEKRHPGTQVMSRETGYDRDYDNPPYKGYDKSNYLYFPVSNSDERYSLKTWVFGIELDGKYKAYPFPELEKSNNKFRDKINGIEIDVQYNPESRSAIFTTLSVKEIPSITLFWFAWMAFHPKSEVFKSP